MIKTKRKRIPKQLVKSWLVVLGTFVTLMTGGGIVTTHAATANNVMASSHILTASSDASNNCQSINNENSDQSSAATITDTLAKATNQGSTSTPAQASNSTNTATVAASTSQEALTPTPQSGVVTSTTSEQLSSTNSTTIPVSNAVPVDYVAYVSNGGASGLYSDPHLASFYGSADYYDSQVVHVTNTSLKSFSNSRSPENWDEITATDGKSYWVNGTALAIPKAVDITGQNSVNFPATITNGGGVFTNVVDKYTQLGGYNTPLIGAHVTVIAEYTIPGSTTWVMVQFANSGTIWMDENTIFPNLYKHGPAIDESATATDVNYKATIKSNWNLMDAPWTLSGHTLAYYSDIIGTNFLGNTVTVNEELSAGSTSCVLVTLPNNSSYWVDKASLDIPANPTATVLNTTLYTPNLVDKAAWKDFYNGGSRIYTIKPTTTSYPLYSGAYGDGTIIAYSKDLAGTFYLASKEDTVQLSTGDIVTAVYITNDNVNWYWVDKNALSLGADGTSSSKQVDYATAYSSLIGSGANGAIKYYVDSSMPLSSEIQAAANWWNSQIPGLFVQSNSPTDVNINFDQVELGGPWASTSFGRTYYISTNQTINGVVVVHLDPKLAANASNNEQGTISIIEHELGHALGLGHSGDVNTNGLPANWSFENFSNLMFSSSDGSSQYYTTITSQQINVIKFIRQMGWTYVGTYYDPNTKDSLPTDIAIEPESVTVE